MDDPKRDDFRRLETAVRGGRVAHTHFLEPDEADRLAARLRGAGAQVEADGGVTGAKRRVLTAFPEHIPAANTPLAALYVEGAPSEGDLLAAVASAMADIQDAEGRDRAAELAKARVAASTSGGAAAPGA